MQPVVAPSILVPFPLLSFVYDFLLLEYDGLVQLVLQRLCVVAPFQLSLTLPFDAFRFLFYALPQHVELLAAVFQLEHVIFLPPVFSALVAPFLIVALVDVVFVVVAAVDVAVVIVAVIVGVVVVVAVVAVGTVLSLQVAHRRTVGILSLFQALFRPMSPVMPLR